MSKNFRAIGEDVWKTKIERINLEFFVFTYGSLVVQLIKDYEDYSSVNAQLDKIGYNMGTRLIDDFLARTQLKSSNCRDFKTVMEIVAKVGFKMYLNVVPNILNIDSTNCTLSLPENPFSENVELPLEAISNGLWYSNVYCGILRGALEEVQLDVTVSFLSDVLRGDETTEIKIVLNKILDELVPVSED
ncbi:Trafficking protein particle complex subunit BET3 [Smittium mucronatum]|uniref:Trafficking protein particle complex subunit BET3 n=1 Tax=Smittium mucronatum TaxID=133383 RepID=A0A1R0GSC9_9FUNG|nr:Trafficking protein particle complex subunit BET3 [Smittium mucronatum]OLY85275.1 Trafficking protein particle complex subunit BET3 [Smittium mucronatum]